VKGIFWNTLGSIIFSANSVLMLIVVSREFGVVAAGEFGVANTTAQLLYIVGIFGVNAYQMTDYNEKYSFAEYFSVKIITSIIMMVLCLCIITLTGCMNNKNLLTLLLTLFMCINSIAELFQSFFFQHNRLDLSGKSLFTRNSLSFVIFYISVKLKLGINSSLILMIITNLLATYFNCIRRTNRFSKINMSKNVHKVKSLLLECIPVFLSLFLMTFMTNCSKYVIEFLANDEVQGYFNIIFFPAMVINLCSSFIFKPLLNKFSSFIENNDVRRFINLLRRQIGFILVFTFICCLACIIAGPSVLGFFFKVDLTNYMIEMIIILFGGGCLAIAALLYYLLIILRMQKFIFLNYVICTILCIFLSVFLVSKHLELGASIAFSISYLILDLIFIFILIYQLRRLKNARDNRSYHHI